MSRNNWLSLNLPDDVRDDLFTVADYVTSNAGELLRIFFVAY